MGQATKTSNIEIALLSSGHSFASGSQFSEEDFLRLRILHKISTAAQLYKYRSSVQAIYQEGDGYF